MAIERCFIFFTDPEINMNITHVQSYRNFCNKIWQGYRFVADKIGDDYESSIDLKVITLILLHKKHLQCISFLTRQYIEDIE
jgi:valyl-tRNA synthetase